MTEEQRIVYTNGVLLQARMEMEGMIAENKQRELRGESMAFLYDDFDNLINKYGIYHNALITNLVGH